MTNRKEVEKMAYTKNDAKNTLYGYMGLEPDNIVYVENTDQRGAPVRRLKYKWVKFPLW